MTAHQTLIDTFRHKGLRQKMVAMLAEKGISDRNVLEAMGRVPRHLFIDTVLDHAAYEDRALPILCNQTISRPSTVAFQSELLGAESGMKVLEIGTGSGYQTAVLCAMDLKVYTIERQKELFESARKLLSRLHFTAKCFLGDGYKGLTEVDYGPYDRVIITCGAPSVPQEVFKQLKVGGVMVIPVGEERQEMVRLVKTDETNYTEQHYGDCNFVPMLSKVNFGSRI